MNAPAKIPVISYDEDEAQDAYVAYVAILTQERLDPSLRDNIAWTKLRQAAFANFYCAFALEDA